MEIMKIYKFYKSPSKEVLQQEHVRELSIEDKYPLYAITNKKDAAKEFRSSRNMDKFIEIRTEIEDKSEWVEFANKHAGSILQYYEYETLESYTNDEPKVKRVEILSTWEEREYTSQYTDEFMLPFMQQIMGHVITPFAVKGEYQKALEKLQYINVWKWMTGVERSQHIMSYDECEEYGDYSPPNFRIDEFQAYLYLFSSTFR